MANGMLNLEISCQFTGLNQSCCPVMFVNTALFVKKPLNISGGTSFAKTYMNLSVEHSNKCN